MVASTDILLALTRFVTFRFLDVVQVNRNPGLAESSAPAATLWPLIHIEVSPGHLQGDVMHDAENENEKIPFIQQLLDNPFLLLFLGVMIPMIVYSLWGVIDILTVPMAK